MSGSVYLYCAAICILCAVMLIRAYRRTRVRLLLWSGLYFVLLMLENVIGYIDVEIIPDISIVAWRKLPGLAAVAVLLFGLIWESK